MINPLDTSPNETPGYVYDVVSALAFQILPLSFLSVCLAMWFSRTAKPPYLAVFCIFGSMGAFCVSIYTAHSPVSILGSLIAFVASPILLIRIWFALRGPSRQSVIHRIVRWASLAPILILIFFILWRPAKEPAREDGGGGSTPLETPH